MCRKTLYDPNEFPLLAEKYAREGLSDKQIFEKLGISKNTYYEYQNKYADFKDAIKRGKKPVDVEVENALLKRALGYQATETIKEVKIGKDGLPTPSTIRTITKDIPPDVGAMVFWLKNRQPQDWQERKVVGLEKVDKIEITYDSINED